jgi:hypothetical protein
MDGEWACFLWRGDLFEDGERRVILVASSLNLRVWASQIPVSSEKTALMRLILPA